MILSDNADTEDNKFLQSLNNEDSAHIKSYKRAFITGISGGLLAACLSNGIACRGLVIPSSVNIPDPEGAAILLESVNRLSNESIKINVEPLRKWATNLKKELGEMSTLIQRQQPIDEKQQGMYT